jgi:hypothetical protein
MALGCATVTTFLTLKMWRLFRAKELSFYRFNLKAAGKIRKAGWAFATFAFAGIGLNAHSGWVRYHEFLGSRAFQKIHVPDELALAQVNPARWLSSVDRQNVLAGKEHLQAASNLGLFVNSEALPKLAWFEYLLGNAEQFVQVLGQAAPGVQPVFLGQEQTIDYAICRACFRSGEIRVVDPTGVITRIIPFDDTNRRLCFGPCLAWCSGGPRFAAARG